MALLRTAFTPDSAHARGNNAAAFTTASHSIPANSVALVLIYGCADSSAAQRPSTYTCSRSAGTLSALTKIGDTGNPVQWGYGVIGYYLQNTTGSAISTTFTVQSGSSAVGSWDVQVIAYTGHNTTTPIAGWIAGTASTGTGAGSVTLSATPVAGDEVVGGLAGVATTSGTYTVGEGSGFTRQFLASDTTTECYSEAQYVTGVTSTTVNWTSVGASGTALEAMLFGLIVKAASGGSTYNLGVAETSATTDAPSGVLTTSQTVTESVTATDTPSQFVGNLGAIAEAASAADAPNGIASMAVACAEVRTASDAPSGVTVTAQAVSEAISGSDATGNNPPPVITVKQYWYRPFGSSSALQLQTGYSNPCTIAAGATMVAIWAGWDTSQLAGPTDNVGTFTSPTNGTQFVGGKITSGLAHQANASGGSHTISPPVIAAAEDGEGACWILEVQNMSPTINVRGTFGAAVVGGSPGFTQSWAQSSDTTPQVGDLCFALTTYENNADYANAALTDPPSTWTSIGAVQDGINFVPTETCYKIATAASTQTAAWSTTDPTVTEYNTVMMILVPPASSGSTYSVSDSESCGAADAPANSLVAAVAQAESATAADAPLGAMVTTRSVAESSASAESTSAALVTPQSLSESTSSSDVPSVALIAIETVSEAGAAADVPSAALATPQALGESASVADAPDGSMSTAVGASESTTAADAPSALGTVAVSTAESAAGADAPTAALVTPQVIAASIGADDVPAAMLAALGAITESAATDDDTFAAKAGETAIFEELDQSDDPAASMTTQQVVGDSSGTSDSPSAVAAVPQTASESITAADQTSTNAQVAGSISEAATGSDSTASVLVTAQSIAEVLVSADASAATAILSALVAESSGLADAVNGIAVMGVSLAEALTAADLVSQGAATSVSIAESASAADSAAASRLVGALIVDVLAATDATGASAVIVAQALESMSPLDVLAATRVMALALAEMATTSEHIEGGGAVLTLGFGDALSAIDAVDWNGVAYGLLRTFIFPVYSRVFEFSDNARITVFPAYPRLFNFRTD